MIQSVLEVVDWYICTVAETILIDFPQHFAVLKFPLHKCTTFRKLFLFWENILFEKYQQSLQFGQIPFCIWTNTIWYMDKYNLVFGQIHLMLLSSSVWRSARHELQSSIREPSLENFDKSASDFKNPDLQICSNVKVVSHLLLASCWLRCVLLAQFAISVSASLRIRSDFVLDECALESEKGSKISDGSSTNGRCRGIGSFRDYPHSWYDQRTIRDILPLYPLQKPCFEGKPLLVLA